MAIFHVESVPQTQNINPGLKPWVKQGRLVPDFIPGLRHGLNLYIFLSMFLGIFTISPLCAGQLLEEVGTTSETFWSVLRKKLRSENFSELMTPGFAGNPSSIPTPDGARFDASNIYNILWVDYDLGGDYKLLYWQRAWFYIASDAATQAMTLTPRDPRFAIRKTHVLGVSGMNSTYDLYVEAGTSPNAADEARMFSVGFRTNQDYEIPSSHWNVGLITDFRAIFYKTSASNEVPNAGGWAALWASYNFSKVFSTQQYLWVNFFWKQGTGFYWDLPLPYIQNGIGINLTQAFSVAIFINNYVFQSPTLENTWASVWFMVNIL